MNFSELDLIILKSILTSKKNALDFLNEGDSKLFSSNIWNAANLIINYIKTYKEIPTLKVILDKLSKTANVKLADHVKEVWSQLDNIEINESEFKYDLDKIKKRYAESQIIIAKDLLNNIDPGNINVSKVLSDLQKTIHSVKDLNKSKTYESKTVKEYLPTFVEKYNAKKDNINYDKGLKTKYSFIDYATNGLKPADFMLIAGESGFGKSLFLKNIAIQVWMQNNTIDSENFTEGKNIAYFSLEMPYEDCFNRFISRLSGVSSRNIENSKLDKDSFLKIKKCLDFIKKYPFSFKIIDIAEATSNDLDIILCDCDENFDAVFIDYLGIMRTNEKSEEADWLKQGIISQEVRAIARKYNIPVFSAVQLNRKGGKDKNSSENIGLSRLARSATIATHATHVIQIENRQNEDNYPDFLYHIIKNRKGPKGKGVLYKNLSCATLIDKNEDEINEQFTDIDDISEESEKLNL